MQSSGTSAAKNIDHQVTAAMSYLLVGIGLVVPGIFYGLKILEAKREPDVLLKFSILRQMPF
jgi:hypothetical protein